MRIANPIYDAVFKYLMDDNSLAKLLLSTILDEEIVDLVFTPQEHSAKLEYPHHFTVYRLDFAATLQNAAGETRKVLIEVQKAKLATDIMRFRRYLGEQYRNPNNVLTVNNKKQALPLLTVYFLGHGLEHSTAPVIHVRRESRDLATQIPLIHKEGFIESLTHDSYIIQIPHLGEHRRTAVEELLQIFNQSRISNDKHILNINETDIDPRYRPILRRLQRAIAEQEVEEAMAIEDDILTELQDLERVIETERTEKEKAQVLAEHAQAQMKQAQAQVEQAQAQVEQAQAQVEQTTAEKEQERMDKEKAQLENIRLLALLKQADIQP